MNKIPNLHSKFFSSLNQVEKRLKLDNSSPSLRLSTDSPPPQPPVTESTSTESLSSPIYLHIDHHHITNQTLTLDYSETPNEFLSISHEDSHLETPRNCPETVDDQIVEDVDVDDDEIELLIKLLGLLDFERDESKLDSKTCSSCRCGGGFYEKIVGMKGPKCDKELERLDGWIRHFGKERIEPLRMAHLLLGKAALLSDDINGFEGLDFPSTVEEFLKNDPPID